MKKRYIKENKKVLKFINNRDNKIIEIKPIKKIIKKGFIYETIISSYCVFYE